MSLLTFFEWLQYSSLLSAMRGSPWIFPLIASIHLMGLALIGGSVLLVDLRLLGLGMRHQPLAQVARDCERWLLVSLVILLPTGVLQFIWFASTKDYYMKAFWIKIAALALALLFTFAVRRRVVMADETRMSSIWNKLVAGVSLGLLGTVFVPARCIRLPSANGVRHL